MNEVATTSKEHFPDPADVYREAIELNSGVPYQRNLFAEHYTFVGRGIGDLVGIPVEEFTFKKLRELILEWHVEGEDSTSLDAKKLAQQFLEGEVKNYRADLKIRTPQGKIKWISDCSVPVHDKETGRVISSLGILQDITARRESEAELRRREALFRGIFEQSVMGILLCNTDEQITATNAAFQRMLGYSEEELLGMFTAELTHPDDIELENEMLQELLAGKRDTVQIEKRLIRKDERSFWGHLSVSLVRDVKDTPLFLMGMLLDISERKKTEEALRASEEQFALFMKYLPAAAFIKERESRPVYLNHYMLRMFGLDPSDNRPTEKLFPGPPGKKMVEADKRAFETGYVKMEENLQLADGSTHSYETHKFIIPKKNGSPLLGGIGIDITARKQAERDLQESHRRYNDLVAKIPVGVFRVLNSPETGPCFDYVSPRFCKLVDISEEELKEDITQIHRIFEPDELDSFMFSLQKSMDEGNPLAWEGKALIRGDTRWIHIESHPTEIRDDFTVWDGIHIDITDRKKAENERLEMERRIQQAQRLESLGVLAGGVAHDFNNILMAILGYADLALIESEPSSNLHNSIREILKASHRAAELCNQMLAYSGKGHFVVKNLDLNELVVEMLQLLRTSISKHSELNLDLASSLLPIHADVTQIRQIIMNLITNASESMDDETGVVSIRTYSEFCDEDVLSEIKTEGNVLPGRYVILQISDSGCGMDEKTVRQVFEPFFTTKFTGRGLGLSAVLGIVRGHRGGIKVDSRPGEGTTFSVYLPVSEAETAGGKATYGQMADWNCVSEAFEGTVLLVDDEESVREVSEKMLEWFGLKVLKAENGQQAYKIYSENRDEIDCVLLDLTMPMMNGEDVLRMLRLCDPNVRVIISSGYDKKDTLSRFDGEEVVGFIQKPYTLAGLKKVLKKVLTRASES